jgi:hypothetical protein
MPFARGQRRRRSNRPGNSQATGPLGCVTLWKAPLAFGQAATEGEVLRHVGDCTEALRSPDRGGSYEAAPRALSDCRILPGMFSK